MSSGQICVSSALHRKSLLFTRPKGWWLWRSLAVPPPTPLPHALDDAEEGCKVVMTDALYINHSYLMVNSH